MNHINVDHADELSQTFCLALWEALPFLQNSTSHPPLQKCPSSNLYKFWDIAQSVFVSDLKTRVLQLLLEDDTTPFQHKEKALTALLEKGVEVEQTFLSYVANIQEALSETELEEKAMSQWVSNYSLGRRRENYTVSPSNTKMWTYEEYRPYWDHKPPPPYDIEKLKDMASFVQETRQQIRLVNALFDICRQTFSYPYEDKTRQYVEKLQMDLKPSNSSKAMYVNHFCIEPEEVDIISWLKKSSHHDRKELLRVEQHIHMQTRNLLMLKFKTCVEDLFKKELEHLSIPLVAKTSTSLFKA